MEYQGYTPHLPQNPPPQSPHKATDADLDKPFLDPQEQREKQHRESQGQLNEISAGLVDLKKSVDRLEDTRRIEWAILIVTTIGVAVTILGFFLKR